MKKIFTLLLTLLFAVRPALALGEGEFEFYINNKGVETYVPTKDKGNIISYDTSTGAKFSTNNKFCPLKSDGNTRDVLTFTSMFGESKSSSKAVKMEGGDGVTTFPTKIFIDLKQISKVVIIQSTVYGGDKNLLFDDVELTDATVVENENVKVYELINVAEGRHTITRNKSEIGIAYIGVKYTGLVRVPLAAPEISYVPETGQVTITKPEGAVKVVYTTDGSYPSANSTEYTAPFTVSKDGTVVKAIAIGSEADNTANSDVASEMILLASGTISAPVFKEFNGAFSLSCATPGAKLEYSLDGGKTWNEYNLPVTLFTSTEVIAKASRNNWGEKTTSKSISVPEYYDEHHHVIIGGGSYKISQNEDGGYDAVGVWGDPKNAWGINLSVDKGYTLTSGDNNHKIKIYGRPVDYDDNTTRKVIMTEENAEITMSIPDGVSVTRIFFYTVIHEDEVPENCHWEVLYGDKWMSSAEVPEESTDVNDPAVRVFTFDKVSDHITFRHVGCAPHFCLAVNIVYDDVDTAEHNMGGDVNGIGTKGAPVSIELSTQYSHQEIYYKFENFATYAVSRADNVDHTGYTKLERTNGKHILTIPADTSGALTYYSFDPYTNVKSEENTMTFDAATTGIDDVVVDGNDAPVEYFNLQGQRVANPISGNLYIVRQGNTVRKLVL